MKTFVVFLEVMLFWYIGRTDGAALQCKNAAADVSWAVFYQVPSTQTAHAIFAGPNPTWEAAPVDLVAGGTSLESLFTPFYTPGTKPDYNLVAFSNFPPLFRRTVECGSDAKGVLAWTDNDGWYLSHTVEKWPDFTTAAYAAPPAGKANLIVCVTVPLASYESLGTAFEYQDPMIYYYISASKQGAANTLDSIPSLKGLTRGSTLVYSPYTMNYKFTIGGATATPAYVISKLPRAFHDVYSGYMSLMLKQTLLVWSNSGNRRLLPSSCSGIYKVENVKPSTITVQGTTISRRQDTSNWAISKIASATAVFCVSSAPRTQAASNVGSGVLCIEQQQVQTLFNTIATATGIEACP